MTMRITTIENGGEAWDAYVERHPDATSYHRWGWKGVVEKSFGHATHYLMAADDADVPHGVLPLVFMKSLFFGKFLVSLPFFNYGGLLCDTPLVAAALIKAAGDLLLKVQGDYVEMRHLTWKEPGLPTREHKVTMILPLAPTPEQQWTAFNAKLRNQVRKAEKSGLQTVVGGRELLGDFYDVFARNMRDLGTPVYSRSFFLNVLESFPGCSAVFVVRLGSTPVAAGIVCWFRDWIEMPWASSVKRYKNLCPNNMLYWEAIRFAIDKGFDRFDFGRSTPGEGTFRFKEQWGAQPKQLFWQYLLTAGTTLPDLNPHNPKYAAAVSLWQKLPVFLTRAVGPSIVRCIP